MKSSKSRRRSAAGAGLCALAATAALGIGTITSAGAQAPATTSAVVLGVGANASQRVVSWYASANTAQSVQVAPTASLSNGAFPASATTFAATVTANTVNGAFNGHAVLNGLQEDTAYSYRVGAEGGWSPTYTFKTQKFTGGFDFLFYGDPQIGSSGNVPKDGAGWDDTLNVSLTANPNTELLVSGGDQVETANTETQWNAFLNSDKLRSYPWAATIGNHDVGGKAYDQHFWTPNTDRSANFYSGSTTTQSGGDYWYVYKDVLFIHLNSNAYASGKDAAHVGYVTNVVNAHGPEARYTVLVFHHAIYSPAAHANDGDNAIRRQDFPTAFSNLGVDLVLAGHDHSYSRSYALKNGQKANASEQPGAAQIATGPGGVIYVTGNSASGSKYYDLSTPRAGEFGPDPLDPTGKRHYANSVENQEHVRTYVKVQVRNDALTIENIRSGTCAAPNAAVEVGNVDWCGPNSGANAAQPVGSVVDKVVIHAAEAPANGGTGGTVPATLGLTLGSTSPSFGAFTPGVAKDYTATGTATVTSTAGDATLTASDPSFNAPGRLVNGTFALASPLQVAGTALPSTIKTYGGPVSNDNVTIDFKQPIAANEPLRTGSYTKTLTFTLSTTNP